LSKGSKGRACELVKVEKRPPSKRGKRGKRGKREREREREGYLVFQLSVEQNYCIQSILQTHSGEQPLRVLQVSDTRLS
jgi:hypothetical protein